MQIDVHSLPALISLVLMTILAAIGWLDRHSRLNTAFALFTSFLTLVSLFGFLGLATADPGKERLFYRLMLLVLTPTFWAGAYYVLVLTGLIDDLQQRLLGLRLWQLGILALATTGLAQVIVQTTTLLADFDAPTTEQIFRPQPGTSWFIAILGVIGVYLIVAFFALLVRAWRASVRGTPERTFLLLNVIGVGEVYLAGPGLAKTLAFVGVDGRPWIFVSYTLASVIFYVALVRYQRDRIRVQIDEISELNRSLEQKVEQRTQHLREAQARLAQAEKMASLGRLAAGVAHEVNNPLGALRSSNATSGQWRIKLARAIDEALPTGDGPQGGRARAVIDQALGELDRGERVIAEGADRVAETVDRLRSFARLDQADLQVVDLRRCVEDTLALEPAIQDGQVTVHREFDSALPRVACYPAQLNQVLQNVVTNAVDAMAAEGDLWVRTAAEEGEALIAVRDSGSGIPEELLARVFDPGFTTKSRGIGTGLGLAICYQVMRDHGGSIAIASTPGQGTTVTVRLPLRTAADARRSA